jgi:esterase/lipase
MRFVADINKNEEIKAAHDLYMSQMAGFQETVTKLHAEIEVVHEQAAVKVKEYFNSLADKCTALGTLPEDFSHDDYGIKFDEESGHIWISRKKKPAATEPVSEIQAPPF